MRNYPKFLQAKDIQMVQKQEYWRNPVQGLITSSCGERENPILHKKEFHNGIDIAAEEDTKVVAAKSGVITEVRYSPTFGKVLKFKTNDGFIVMYAHLNDSLVKEGERIVQGQVIAKVGNTGLSTGPHLHYSVWKGDMPMNPMQFVTLDYTEEVRQEYAARGVELH